MARNRAAGIRPATPLIGREQEIMRTFELLAGAGVRLVTLTGPPGVGKTSILQHVVHQLDACGRDVRFVSLRDVGQAGVLGAIARGLGIGTRSSARVSTIARAADRMEESELVLVLDEAERVLDEVASLVAAWVDGTSVSRILVSSRERLDLPIEHVVTVDPLPLAAAVTLFRQALGRAGRGPEVSTKDAQELVATVDCLPLGIELLASRVAALGPADILERPLSLPPLDAALQASALALDDDERFALAALSVFKGSFSLDAASVVLSPEVDAAQAIARLVDASLLRRCDGDDDARSRFEMLTVIRSFAERDLRARDRATEIADRHLAAFERLLETVRDSGRSLDGDRENLLAAFDRAVEVRAVRAIRLLALALDGLLVRQGPPELHREILTRALELSNSRPGDATLEAELHRAYNRFLALRSRFRDALAAATRAAALAEQAGDRRVAAWIAASECFDRRPLGELDDAERAGRSALAYATKERDLPLEAMAEQALGLVEHARNAHPAACERFLRAAAAARRCGNVRFEGIAVANQSLSLHALGDHAAATEYQAEARRCFASIDDRYHLARILPNDVAIARAVGDLPRAEATFAAARDAVRDLGDLGCEAELLLEGARVAAARSARAQAEARLEEARLVLREVEDVFLHRELASVMNAIRETVRVELVLEVDRIAGVIELVGGAVGRVRIDLSRRNTLRRLVFALVDRHASPRPGLDIPDALEAGWPGERMRAESGSARVYMAIRRLRELGLEEVILTQEEGYALDPLVRVVTT